MTLEELKAEAKAQGYRLIKIQPYIRIMPCKCGTKRINHWYYSNKGEFYKCPNCGLEAPLGKNDREARKLWNQMVEGE